MQTKFISNKRFYVYKIINHINGKIYIGKSNTNKNRWKDHLSIAERKPSNSYSYLHKSINKYGVNNFTFEIIQYFDNEIDAYASEKQYILLYNSNNTKYGMNLNSGGLGGMQHNEEIKDKIRQKRLGFKFTEASKLQMSVSHKNQRPKNPKFTDEQVIKMRKEYNLLKLYKKKNILQILADKYNAAKITISYVVSGRNYKHIPLEEPLQLPNNMKVCSVCHELKLKTDFSNCKRASDKLFCRCKVCDSKVHKKYKKKMRNINVNKIL